MKRVRTTLLLVLVTSQWQIARAFAEAPFTKLSGGLEASVNWVGRNLSEGRANVSVTIKNAGSAVAYIGHIGPLTVVDNAGASYQYPIISGISNCSAWGGGEECLKNSLQNDPKFVDTLTEVDPGVSITMTIGLQSGKAPATLVTFATVIVARFVDDPLNDNTLTEVQKIKQLKRLNLSIQNVPITRSST